MSGMYTNPGPGNYATAKGKLFEGEAKIAAAAAIERGDANIVPHPVRDYSFRRGLLFALLTIPIAAALVAVLGLNSPTAGVATTPLALVVAFALFARGSARLPVAGEGFVAALGIGAITMVLAAAISYPYSLYLTYLYDGGSGSILSSDFARSFSTWIDANVGLMVASAAVVTVISLVVVWKKARAARASTTASQ